jgi:hypothetical protein
MNSADGRVKATLMKSSASASAKPLAVLAGPYSYLSSSEWGGGGRSRTANAARTSAAVNAPPTTTARRIVICCVCAMTRADVMLQWIKYRFRSLTQLNSPAEGWIGVAVDQLVIPCEAAVTRPVEPFVIARAMGACSPSGRGRKLGASSSSRASRVLRRSTPQRSHRRRACRHSSRERRPAIAMGAGCGRAVGTV